MVEVVDDEMVVPVIPRGAGEQTSYHHTQQGESNKQRRAKEAIHSRLRTVSFQQASLIAPLVRNLPAMQETPVQFLSQEDLLEKG